MSWTLPAIRLMNKTQGEERLSLFTLGASLGQEFCRINHIYSPTYVIRSVSSTGLYDPESGTVFVNLDATVLPVKKPSHMRWSHPGWKTDRTAFGVCLHETGHHFEFELAKLRRWNHTLWKKSRAGKRVSGYEPNWAESFAETMRLFIGNPDLLRRAIPLRYNYITEVLGLKPVITAMDYKEAIGNPTFNAAADKWVA